jgi:hypothetical protein
MAILWSHRKQVLLNIPETHLQALACRRKAQRNFTWSSVAAAMASASSSETYPLLQCSHHAPSPPSPSPSQGTSPLSLSLSLCRSLSLSPAPASPLSNLTVAPMSSSTAYHLSHRLRHVDRSPATSSQRGLMDDDRSTVPLPYHYLPRDLQHTGINTYPGDGSSKHQTLILRKWSGGAL